MNESDEGEVHASRKVKSFLGRCTLLVRLRRFLAAFMICLAVAGAVPLTVRFFGIDLYSARYLPYLLLPVVLSLPFMLLPVRGYSVEIEVDRNASTGCTFSAFSSPSSRNSALYGNLVDRAAKAAASLSPFRCIRISIGKWLPAAILGVLLCTVGIVVPASQLYSTDQVFVRLIEDLRRESAPSAGSSESGTSEFSRQVERVLDDIKKKWESGDRASALARLNEILNAARNRLAEAADEREREMVKAGIDSEISRILANGGLIPTNTSSVSPEALADAGKRIGGAFGASLSKASSAVAGSLEQARLLAEAAQVAGKLKNDEIARLTGLTYIAVNSETLFTGLSEEERKKFLDLFADTSSKPHDGSDLPNSTSGGPANVDDSAKLLSVAVNSPQYPVRLRSVLIRYLSKE